MNCNDSSNKEKIMPTTIVDNITLICAVVITILLVSASIYMLNNLSKKQVALVQTQNQENQLYLRQNTLALAKEYESCSSMRGCENEFVCDGTSFVCKKRNKNPCTTKWDCAPEEWCIQSKCKVVKKLGKINEDCPCDYSHVCMQESNTCKLAIGTLCNNDIDCWSGLCNSPFGTNLPKKCTAFRVNGDLCIKNSDCNSNNCAKITPIAPNGVCEPHDTILGGQGSVCTSCINVENAKCTNRLICKCMIIDELGTCGLPQILPAGICTVNPGGGSSCPAYFNCENSSKTCATVADACTCQPFLDRLTDSEGACYPGFVPHANACFSKYNTVCDNTITQCNDGSSCESGYMFNVIMSARDTTQNSNKSFDTRVEGEPILITSVDTPSFAISGTIKYLRGLPANGIEQSSVFVKSYFMLITTTNIYVFTVSVPLKQEILTDSTEDDATHQITVSSILASWDVSSYGDIVHCSSVSKENKLFLLYSTGKIYVGTFNEPNNLVLDDFILIDATIVADILTSTIFDLMHFQNIYYCIYNNGVKMQYWTNIDGIAHDMPDSFQRNDSSYNKTPIQVALYDLTTAPNLTAGVSTNCSTQYNPNSLPDQYPQCLPPSNLMSSDGNMLFMDGNLGGISIYPKIPTKSFKINSFSAPIFDNEVFHKCLQGNTDAKCTDTVASAVWLYYNPPCVAIMIEENTNSSNKLIMFARNSTTTPITLPYHIPTCNNCFIYAAGRAFILIIGTSFCKKH